MTKFLFLTFLVAFISSYSQEQSDSLIVAGLKKQLITTKGPQRLQILDSLNDYYYRDASAEADASYSESLELSLELDSLTKASEIASDILWRKTNIQGKPQEAQVFYQNFITRNKITTDLTERSRLYLNAGDSYLFDNKPEQALILYDSASIYADQLPDRWLSGFVTLAKGQAYARQGNDVESLRQIEEAALNFRKAKDTFNIIGSTAEIAFALQRIGLYEEAELKQQEIRNLAKASNDNSSMAISLYNSAHIAEAQGKDELRINYLERAFHFNDNTEYKDFVKPGILAALVVAYAQQKNKERAQYYFKLLNAEKETYRTGKNKASFLNASKEMERLNGNLLQARELGIEHLDMVRSHRGNTALKALKFLAEVSRQLGREPDYENYYLDYLQKKDSFISNQKANVVIYYKTKFDLENQLMKIQEQQAKLDILAEKSKTRNLILIFSLTGLAILFVFILMVRSRNQDRARKKLQEDFTSGLLQNQEQERKRIAGEMHDSIGQKLVLLKKAGEQNQPEEVERMAQETINEVRQITEGLFPMDLERFGLTKALEKLINAVDRATGILFLVELEPVDNLLKPEAELYIYRFVQEALNNLVKHSGAKSACVKLERSASSIEIFIEDKGAGFSKAEAFQKETLGLRSLKQRAQYLNARFQLETEPAKGTSLTLIIPVYES